LFNVRPLKRDGKEYQLFEQNPAKFNAPYPLPLVLTTDMQISLFNPQRLHQILFKSPTDSNQDIIPLGLKLKFHNSHSTN